MFILTSVWPESQNEEKTAQVFVLKQNFSSFIKHIEEKKKGGVKKKNVKCFGQLSGYFLFSQEYMCYERQKIKYNK